MKRAWRSWERRFWRCDSETMGRESTRPAGKNRPRSVRPVGLQVPCRSAGALLQRVTHVSQVLPRVFHFQPEHLLDAHRVRCCAGSFEESDLTSQSIGGGTE